MVDSYTKRIFLGRTEQLKQLHSILTEVIEGKNELPRVALVYGLGGIGKSTLVERFLDEAGERHRGNFEAHTINWEDRRAIDASLKGRPEDIEDVNVLRSIHEELRLSGARFQKAQRQYNTAVIAFQKAVAREASVCTESSKTAAEPHAAVAGLAVDAASTIAGYPAAGKVGKFMKEALQQYGGAIVDGARKLISPKNTQLLEEGSRGLARGLAYDLEAQAMPTPLVIFLDTYEIVDEVDPMLRTVIASAGPQVLWLIAGRNDIYRTSRIDRDRRSQAIDGYNKDDGHKFSVLPIDVTSLAKEDIREYFVQAVPERLRLDDAQLGRVHKATMAIPLAIELAAKIWAKTGSVDDIQAEGDRAAQEIVEEMVARFQQHCVDPEDKHALAAVAMANGDDEVLRAMIGSGDEEFVLSQLARIRRRYSVVQRQSASNLRLHDEPAMFYMQQLRGPWRCDDWVRLYAERALAVFRERFVRVREAHVRLEDLCEDNDYIQCCTGIVNLMFWTDEDAASCFLTLRYVEGWAYNSNLQNAVLEAVKQWQGLLSDRSEKRAGIMVAISGKSAADKREKLVRLLSDDMKRGWLEASDDRDSHVAERQAIYHWIEAELHRDSRPRQCYESLKRAVSLAPAEVTLLRRIASSCVEVRYMHWMKKEFNDCLQLSQLIIRCDQSDANNWHYLGNSYSWLGRHAEALECALKALDIDDGDATNWRSVGDSYAWLGRYAEALEYSQKALDMDDGDARNWRSVGVSYAWTGRFAETLEYSQKALKMDDSNAEYWRDVGGSYSWMGQLQLALEHLRKAIALDSSDQCSFARTLLWMNDQRGAANAIAKSLTSAMKWQIGDILKIDGLLKYNRGELVAARLAFEEAIEASPANPELKTAFWALSMTMEDTNAITSAFASQTQNEVEHQKGLLNYEMCRALLASVEGNEMDALKWLEEAVQRIPAYAFDCRFRPEFAPLLDHPEFQKIVRVYEGPTPTEVGPES